MVAQLAAPNFGTMQAEANRTVPLAGTIPYISSLTAVPRDENTFTISIVLIVIDVLESL